MLEYRYRYRSRNIACFNSSDMQRLEASDVDRGQTPEDEAEDKAEDNFFLV